MPQFKTAVLTNSIMELLETKPYVLSRKLYVAEAAFEYLVSILVSGAFLARITTELGFSDSLTGVLSAIVSLGCIFQLSSVFIKVRRTKPIAIIFNLLSEVLFLLLYVVPVTPLNKTVKTVAFAAFLISAYFMNGIINTKKMSWLMSLVDDKKRGKFTANKEIISLATGIVFSYAMGYIIDAYKVKGEIKTAFILCAVVILALTVLHTLMLFFSVEPVTDYKKQKGILSGFKDVFKNKTVLSLTVLFVLYRAAIYASSSFYGTYQIKELGFSQTLTAIIVSIGNIMRILFSRNMGNYADKNSFAKMERISLCFLLISFVFAALAVPQNGMPMFCLYYITNGIAMAGTNSALTNLVFDYVEPQKRADSLAVIQAISGLAGFLVTLLAGILVDKIQQNGNTFLGLPLYAQQVVSIISAIITAVAIAFVTFRFIKNKKAE